MSIETHLPSVHTNTTSGPASSGMGTGLFASSDIRTGEDVVKISSPFVAVLDTPRLEDTCSGCFGKRQMVSDQVDLKACTGCQVVKYCDKTCQAKDWKFAHSLECKIFQKLTPNILPSNARAMLRMVLRMGRQKYNKLESGYFMKLETHITDMNSRNPQQWERISVSAQAVKVYSESDLQVELIAAFGAKLDLNAFNLTTSVYDRIGIYLHPYAALINHSCDYNSVVGFDGDELFVKAVRPIKKGEQILISYVDASGPYKVRRKELSNRYFFDCQCSKCSKGTDTPEDRFLTTPPGGPTLKNTEREAHSLLESALGPNTEPTESVRKLESAVRVLHQTSAWPITRQPYISSRDELIASLLSTGRFKTAFAHAAIRYIRVDPIVYPYDSHPIRHIHSWALAKLAIHLSQGIEQNPDDTIALERFGLNFGLIIWSVLNELVKKESESCTVPSFKRMVKMALFEVHQEFVVNGLEPTNMKDDIDREWEKVGALVSATLEKE